MGHGNEGGLRERLMHQGEEAIGKLAQELLENPVVNAAISSVFEAGEKAASAQQTALGALNLPSAADLERLTRRLRSVSQRLEAIEESISGLDGRLVVIETAVAKPAAKVAKPAAKRAPTAKAPAVKRASGASGSTAKRAPRAKRQP